MSEDSAPQGRPRLNLKPRDETVAKQLEIQRTASGKVWGGATAEVSARLRTGCWTVLHSYSHFMTDDLWDPKPAAVPGLCVQLGQATAAAATAIGC